MWGLELGFTKCKGPWPPTKPLGHIFYYVIILQFYSTYYLQCCILRLLFL
jgi:hypothetical protein